MKLGRKPRLNKNVGKVGKTSRQPGAAKISLERAFVLLFLIVTPLLFAGAYLVFQKLQSNLTESLTVNENKLITSYADQVEQSMQHYISAMDLMVKEPALVQALETNNESLLHQREALLAYIFPDALRIRILSPQYNQPDNTIVPPISYSCLDLLDKSRKQGNAKVEVHLFGQADQHIDIIRNITNSENTLLGNLLVTLPVKALQKQVQQMKPASGYIELQQITSGGQSVSIARVGDSAKKIGQPVNTEAVPNTLFRIANWPAADTQELSEEDTLFYWGIVAAIWLVFSIVLFLLYKALQKALLKDQVMVIKLFKDVQQGKMSGQYPISLKNCLGAMEQLRMIAGHMTGLRSNNSGLLDSKNATEMDTDMGDTPETGKEEEFDFDMSSDSLEVMEITDDEMNNPFPDEIFKAYDIRGIVDKTLTVDIATKIGQALGSEAEQLGQKKIVVARDGRLSGPDLSQALINGLKAAGRQVVDIGRVPTPVLYFASHYLGNGSGVMLTGSHNPPDYNGMKMMLGGDTLHGKAITQLKERIQKKQLVSGEGSVEIIDVVPSYIERVTSDVRLERPLKIIVDCGNGVAGDLAPVLYRALGCEVIEMFCDVDGNFPNHHPDPSKPENLVQLMKAVPEQGADLGLAFDGDGDRLGVVDSAGKIIWPDRYLMLMAADVLTRQPGGQIIYDVKCSSHLEKSIAANGGQPLMWKTGHSFIKAKMKETDAQLAGEMSGHIFFKERWLGFDDALYAGARLLEILSSESGSTHDVFSQLPESVSTPELNVKTAEGENFSFMEKLIKNAEFPGAQKIDIDGLRLEFEDGWALVRASNTTPSLVLRFEANDAAALARIQEIVRTQIHAIKPGMELPF